VTCIFRVADFDSETLGVNTSLNGFDHVAFASGARNGVDDEKNVFGVTGDISTEAAKIRVLVIPTDEELVIARDVERLKK